MRLVSLALLFIVIGATLASLPPDPYAVLGLRKGANTKEIKKAYKQLVREWHPDKNDSPSAAERFMEISKAYETLNDPLKKERYDKFGTFEDGPQQDYNPYGFDPFFGSFGHFDQGNSFFSKHRIGLRQYSNTILEKSNTQPFIIFAYSGYCRTCFTLEPTWQSVVEDLEPLGYGVATINAMTDANLLEKLRVSRLPTILVLIEGRAIHFRSDPRGISARSIRIFARDVIPDTFILKLGSYDKLKRFLDQAKPTNKVSVLILGSSPTPRLRYLLSAMRMNDISRFAYVHLGEGTPEIEQMREAMSIKCTQCENILVFNEYPENGPIGRLSISKASELTKESLNNLLDTHRFLLLPRISSPSYLDALCPLSSRSSRILCVWLISTSPTDESIDSFRSFLSNKYKGFAKKNIRVAYISATAQSSFLRPFMDSRSSQVENDSRDIIMLWRSEHTRARFSWFEGAWSMKNTVESGNRLITTIDDVNTGKIKLDTGVVFGQMEDEHMANIFVRFSRKVVRFVEKAWFEISKEETYPVMSAMFAFFAILIGGFCLSLLLGDDKKDGVRGSCPPFGHRMNSSSNDTSTWHPEDPKMNNEGETLTHPNESIEAIKERRIKKAYSIMHPLIHELRAESYFGMIRLLKPGCRSIIILVDAENKQKLLEQFSLSIYPLRNNKTFSFGYLMVEKNLAFFRKLLEHTLPESTDKSAPSMYERLKDINPKQTVGTVLVLCGWKLYFCIYHPMHVTHGKKNLMGLEDDGETDDGLSDSDEGEGDYETKEIRRRHIRPCVSNVLNGFPNWLDRLLEGSIRRYYIPEWPDNLH